MLQLARDHWTIFVLSSFLVAHIQSCGPAVPVQKEQEDLFEIESIEKVEVSPEIPKLPEPPQPVAKKKTEIAKELKLRLVREGDRSNLDSSHVPDPNFSLKDSILEPGVKFDRSTIYYSNIIDLPNPESQTLVQRRQLFFVWPEKFLNSRITYATVSHTIITGENRKIRGLIPSFAHHDVVKEWWYFPVSRLFEDVPNNQYRSVTEAETQVMSLHLELSEGTQHELEVRFKARGVISQ
jgi:hypothetical protein